LKEQARQLLTSEKGVKLRSRRGWEVEGVFGHIKYNRNFRRFMLRGLQKVRTELGLLSLAHNFIKLAASNQLSFCFLTFHLLFATWELSFHDSPTPQFPELLNSFETHSFH